MALSPTQLILIRDQLMKSLAKVRELESQVQMVPSLNETIHDLNAKLAEQTRLNQELQMLLYRKSLNQTSMVFNSWPDTMECNSTNPILSKRLTQFHRTPVLIGLDCPPSGQLDSTISRNSYLEKDRIEMISRGNQTATEHTIPVESLFLDQLQRYVEQNGIRDDPLFDENRFSDLIYCFHANLWHEFLIISNVICLSRMPLPDPPSSLEMDFPLKTISSEATTQTDIAPIPWRGSIRLDGKFHGIEDQYQAIEVSGLKCENPIIHMQTTPDNHLTTIIPLPMHWRYGRMKQSEPIYFYCAECFNHSDFAIVLTANISTHLHVQALPVIDSQYYFPMIPLLIQQKLRVKRLIHACPEKFMNHRFCTSKGCINITTQNSNTRKKLSETRISLFDRYLINYSQHLVCEEQDRRTGTKFLDGEKTIPHGKIPLRIPQEVNNLTQNFPPTGDVPVNQTGERHEHLATPYRVQPNSVAWMQVKPMKDSKVITLQPSKVEDSVVEQPCLSLRRTLWHFSVSLRPYRLKSFIEDQSTAPNPKTPPKTRSRLSLFTSLHWRRARDSKKQQEPTINNSERKNLEARRNSEPSKSENNHKPQCLSEKTVQPVAQSISDFETFTPVVTSTNLPIAETRNGDGCVPNTPVCRPPVLASLFYSESPSKCVTQSKNHQEFQFCGEKFKSTGVESATEKQDRPQGNCSKTDQQQTTESPIGHCAGNVQEDPPGGPEKMEANSIKSSFASRTETLTGLVSVSFLAACQTLAAWLEDSTNISCKALNDATEVVRRNWFQVTSDPEMTDERIKAYIETLQGLPSCPVERVVNMLDENCNTALHYAVSRGRWTVVGVLLSHCPGINVNVFNRAGYTPPMLAAVITEQPSNARELNALEQMLSRADLTLCSANAQRQTVLMLAAIHGRIGLVHRLINMHKAPINQTDAEGSTALMAATEHNRSNVVRLLLSQPDVDTTLRDNDGFTALDIALSRKHHEITLMIYAKAKIQQMKEERLPKAD